MIFCATRSAALRLVLMDLVRRPLRSLLVIAAVTAWLAMACVSALTLWRLWPLEAPWMRPEALVLVAGTQGEIDLSQVQAEVRRVAPAANVEYRSRDEALARLGHRTALAALGLEELRPNPLPDSFVVRFAALTGLDVVEAEVGELRHLKSVDSVEYPADVYRRLGALAGALHVLAIALGALFLAQLAVAVALAALFRRPVERDHLRLLVMLGAPPRAIRRPFVYAAALDLGVAGGLAAALAGFTAGWLEPFASTLAQQFGFAWAAPPFPLAALYLLSPAAALAGALIASIAARRAFARA